MIIATTAAGAIPYYSKLETIDMLGLNDRWVARYGEVHTRRPGHHRVASLDYLLLRKVNLVIGHPWIVPRADPASEELPARQLGRFHLRVPDSTEAFRHWRILHIPLGGENRLVVLYLVRNPGVDAAIRDNGWDVRPIVLD